MPRIFWTVKRKAQLVKDAETMTVKQMARSHFQPVSEIERMLAHLKPGKKLIKRVYRERGQKITVCHPGFAIGVVSQRVGEHRALY